MSRRIKYNPIWETEFEWLKPSQMSDFYALCILCKQYFKVEHYGKSEVVKHSKSQKHVEYKRHRRVGSSQLPPARNFAATDAKPYSKLSKEEEVINAEIIWSLKTIDCNYSFNDACGDCCPILKLMFPDSAIAKNMDLEKTKVKYLTQFGVIPHIEKIIKADLVGSAYSLVIDECRVLHGKIQYDCYLQYWSNAEDRPIAGTYCGSILMQNFRSDHLKAHIFDLLKKWNLDISLMMQVLLTSPNPNTKFLRMLVKEVEECYFTSLLDLNLYTAHPIYTALKKGLCCICFTYEEFLSDLIYFLQLHRNRKSDDKILTIIADSCSKFFNGLTPSRWLLLKPALTKIIEQYKNLKDHFLLFLPKQDNFKREVECTNKYKYIVRMLKDRRTLIYLNFVIHVASIFEPALTNFLKNEPQTHLLHETLTKLFCDLMSNFLKRNVLMRTEKKLDGERLVQIDCRNKNFHLHNVVLNTHTKKEIGLSSLNAKTVADLQNEFLQFYIECTSYLQNKLPMTSEFLKDACHIHPAKRNADGLTRLAKTVINTIKNENVLNRLFHIQGKDKATICDIVANQAKMYAAEKDLSHENLEEHWKYVGQLKNNLGERKYSQLYTVAKCVLVLSHGNSSSEKGYVTNSLIMENNRLGIEEEDLYVIRMTKSYLGRIGGIRQFIINRELIKNVKNSYKKYGEYMDKKRRRKR